MKKTSNRLAVAGAAILLGACAIALAQHDSRKRERETPDASLHAAEVAKPISASTDFEHESTDKSAISHSMPQVVRGNDGPLEEANPLRDSSYEGSYGMESSVVPAAAEGELPSLPTADSLSGGSLPSPPPGLGAAPSPLPDTSQPAPSYDSGEGSYSLSDLPSPSLPSSSSADSAAGNSTPAMPSLPTGGLPKVAGPGPTTPPSSLSSTGYGQEGYGQETAQTQTYGQSGSNAPSPAAPVGYGQAGDPLNGYGQQSATPLNTSPAGVETSMAAVTAPQTDEQPNYANNNAYSQQPSQTVAPQVPASTAAYGGTVNAGSNQPTSMLGPRRTPGSMASLVSDTPGNRYLDGPQTPNVSIEIRPPGEEIQVGKKAAFLIMVSNRGSVDALDVTVVDKVPRGAQFAGSEPQPASAAGEILVWELGRIPAGEDRVIRMNIIPEVEGELGSTASLMFASQASSRVLATQPKLELAVESPPNVLIGDQQNMVLVIRNSGSGIARNVKLTVDVPENLSHPSGASIEGVLADLHPNESRRIDTLAFSAIQPGIADCVIRVLTDDGVQAQQNVSVDVRAPKLVAQIQGPKERYLQREATYTVAVANTGTATATQLEFAVHLPAGFAYVGCDKPAATYDRARHVVLLRLAELPASAKAPFQISLLPIELGNQSISVKTTGDLGIVADASTQVVVNGRAELDFTIGQDNGQIEVGATTTYEVRILNKGDKPDRNVTLVIDLPQGSTVVDVSPKGAVANGNQIQFPPIAEMPIRDSRTYRFVVQHNQSGTQKVAARLISENLNVGVMKEVPTFVYQDD